MNALLLVDKSAYVRGPEVDDELCLCAVTRLEILYSARSPTEYAALERELSLFRDLRMDAETFAAAAGAQRELSETGAHRLPVTDLLIAACAQQHGADVLHVDRHFDALAAVLKFRAVRVD
ncbi:MAG: PIN domain-containing protein [Thermoleophilaceae bacterium]|nr:PIN domain-containing protein [Thermoleophilaceae bacterium]